jgi:hypothetical protein
VTLLARAIALQGFRYSPIMIAVQGLIAAIQAGEILMHMRRRGRR